MKRREKSIRKKLAFKHIEKLSLGEVIFSDFDLKERELRKSILS